MHAPKSSLGKKGTKKSQRPLHKSGNLEHCSIQFYFNNPGLQRTRNVCGAPCLPPGYTRFEAVLWSPCWESLLHVSLMSRLNFYQCPCCYLCLQCAVNSPWMANTLVSWFRGCCLHLHICVGVFTAGWLGGWLCLYCAMVSLSQLQHKALKISFGIFHWGHSATSFQISPSPILSHLGPSSFRETLCFPFWFLAVFYIFFPILFPSRLC